MKRLRILKATQISVWMTNIDFFIVTFQKLHVLPGKSSQYRSPEPAFYNFFFFEK